MDMLCFTREVVLAYIGTPTSQAHVSYPRLNKTRDEFRVSDALRAQTLKTKNVFTVKTL